MNFMKKQALGFYLTGISLLALLVGMIAYLANAQTAYFSQLGINAGVMICTVLGLAAMTCRIVTEERGAAGLLSDILAPVSGVLVMAAFVLLVKARVYGFASILTFENTPQNMADLSSAFTAIIACLLAVIFCIIASFHGMIKEKKD